MKEGVTPRPRAIALKYDTEGAPAPNVVAKGRGVIAGNILELAEKHDIPVRRDGDLLQLLYACDLGDEIPVDLYSAVAELLAYLYELNGTSGGLSCVNEPEPVPGKSSGMD